jgi:1,4-alpha-glucan branching enzyme
MGVIVRFTYFTGLARSIFRNARLKGSWDIQGMYSADWTERSMTEFTAPDGCPAFTATVEFSDGAVGRRFRWGVTLDGPAGSNLWAIPTEIGDKDSVERYREFELRSAGNNPDQRFYFTYCQRLGAGKVFTDNTVNAAIRFSAWAPNARKVEVVFSDPAHGYVADDGTGIDAAMPVIALHHDGRGIWESDLTNHFFEFTGRPYMFRIENAQGQIRYRTDIHSRWQIGRGSQDPKAGPWNGDPKTLDGTVSCSVVIDQDLVRREFEPTTTPPQLITDDEFWSNEFTPGLPVPTHLRDLIIYELHIGSLGFGNPGPGTLADAMGYLDYLTELGVNAVELLPMSEFSGDQSWGYGDTHHLVIESSAGGRDKYKHFVRECHRHGIAVIQDVVYNHFDARAERAEWQYDSEEPEQNIYYWYEGRSTDYAHPDNGYLKNGSSGATPRFWEEPVRQLFISSAAQFIEEFHVDGLRVDLTQAIHRDNSLNMDGGAGVSSANLFGQKFLREWSRTLRLIRPSVFLVAEDHTDWDAVTKAPDAGGLGFGATWHAAFYHNLIGDSEMAGNAARLIWQAGFGNDAPLAIEQFAGILWNSQFQKVVYHESHDEAGNAGGTLRTSKVAVNNAPLFGSTRAYAEARCRVAFGLSLFSAGTPMFFMGEEVVAQQVYKYNNILSARENVAGERAGDGSRMFRCCQDLIRLRKQHPAIRSRQIDILHAHNSNRVLAFTRRESSNELLIVASLNNAAYTRGYVLQNEPSRLPSGQWREIFNSDAGIYGGNNVGNAGAALPCHNGRIEIVIPANAIVIFQRL